MGGPALDYFATRPLTVGTTTYAVGDEVDVTQMSDNTVRGLLRAGYLEASEGPQHHLWNGTAYIEAASSRTFIGPHDPALNGVTVIDGDIWEQTEESA